MSRHTRRKLLLSGATASDAYAADHVHVGVTPRSVVYLDPATDARVEIPTINPPKAGGKPMARHLIEPQQFNGMIGRWAFGGGAYNQAKRMAQRDGLRHAAEISLCDSSAFDPRLEADCRKAGVQLISLNIHNRPVNVVSPFRGDKLIVRSQIVLNGHTVSEGVLEEAGTSDVFVLVSPKDPVTARQLWDAASGARRYFQPTGSLCAEYTRELVGTSDVMACTAAELSRLAASLGVVPHQPEIDEMSPDADARIVGVLNELFGSGFVRCPVAAVTEGPQGVVVFDATVQRAFGIKVRLIGSEPGVPTPSGAGDFWHAEWVYAREIDGLGEPQAAARAARTVAEGIGLARERFAVDTIELGIPSPVGAF